MELLLPETTEVGLSMISEYPPPPCWQAGQIAPFEQAIDGSGTRDPVRKSGPLSLYVHIPFCRQRCSYCYFRTYPNRQERRADPYVDAVLAEADMYAASAAVAGRAPTAVYIGGGTPSYLSVAQIERLIKGLARRISFEAVEEFVFECEPCTVTGQKLAAMRDLGVTRVSMGIQTFDDRLLEAIGRASKREDCIVAYWAARRAGIGQINVDLMAGLPDQTESMFVDSLGAAVALEPDCVTFCQMNLVENSRLYRSMELGRHVELPTWPTKRAWVDKGFAALEDCGYAIRNSRMCVLDPAGYRLVYIEENTPRGADVLALGVSAHGLLDGYQYQNVDTYEGYVANVDRGLRPLWRAHRLTTREAFHREVVLQLGQGSLDLTYFTTKFGIDPGRRFASQVAWLAEQGYLETTATEIRLTRQGLLVADWLLLPFYLPEHTAMRYAEVT